jgi:hypothetical protein
VVVKLREQKGVYVHRRSLAFLEPTIIWLSLNVYSLSTKIRLRVCARMDSFCEAINRKVGPKIRNTMLFIVPIYAINNRIHWLEILISIEPHHAISAEETKKELKAIAEKRRIQIKEEK